ncbi:amino acid adenylation domain-containing protein [Pseudoalteromonas sp. DL2-H2.2]|uniref:non-ribosomal peptide synthetase n=1 Tax=Pseudoalteromonas sp. DL2-H2.2 TaxID=2908889 RepID=UPI001F19E5A1|nr:non-ribosomal peptide synthetase [Pseudoalteromonas sp. DL2-H2.2]MCF2907163.1 amino acid adenylation domain-containing protein [Pseudoalteromonas sp. DL2-H2.2]
MKPQQLVSLLQDKLILVSVSDGSLVVEAEKGAVTAEIAQLIRDNKTQLLAYLSDSEAQPKREAVTPRAEQYQTLAPLSFSQRRLWFIDQLQQGSAQYNMPALMTVTGELDLAVAERACQAIIHRHEVLRTVIVDGEKGALQHIRDEVHFVIAQTNLSAREASARSAQLEALIDEELNMPFDLTQDVMMRSRYILLANPDTAQQQGVLLFNMHHIASDGWSIELLSQEFLTLYRAFAQGEPNPLPELAIQYADYALWQQTWLQENVLESQLSYWQETLADAPSVHSLPLKQPRPEEKQSAAGCQSFSLNSSLSQQLTAAAQRNEMSPFMLVHSALSWVLAQHSNQQDILIGTPVANRLQSELEPLIGFFVNNLVLRTQTRHATLGDYFAHVRDVHHNAQANQDVPFEQLVERLNVERSLSHDPLFQIMLSMDSEFGVSDQANAGLDGLRFAQYEREIVSLKYDIDIDITPQDEGYTLRWTYDLALFEDHYIETLNRHLIRALQLFSDSAASTVLAQLTLMDKQEQQAHLAELCGPSVPLPSTPVHQLIETRAAQSDARIAVKSHEGTLSYQQLNERANQLAHYLRAEHQVGPDTLVGLCVGRSLELMVAVLAILKAGGAYVPLDPDYPQERLSYMVEDTGLSVVLTQQKVAGILSDFNVTAVLLDNASQFAHYPISNPDVALTPDNLAYVMYTSGSTGNPKGVMISHHNLINFAANCEQRYEITEADNVLQFSTMNFDIFVEEWLATLTQGATLVLRDDDVSLSREAFIAFCDSHAISVASLPTAFWHMLALSEAELESLALRLVIVGGEALDKQSVASLKPGFVLLNTYGPTETTVTASGYAISGGYDAPRAVPIGRANVNTATLVLSEQLTLCPPGVLGELYVSGQCLASGYLHQSELTAERFIDNPYFDPANPALSARLYKTGDLVRIGADGEIEFVGRSDDQVKIRGFRVELGEIETQLMSHAEVESAVVLAEAGTLDGTNRGGKVLRAFIQSEQDSSLIDALQQHLSGNLPDYMVPSAYSFVNQWPLTANGKLDKRALLALPAKTLEQPYQAPQTDAEKMVVDIVASLLSLDVDKVGVYANFFALGGHSLLIMQLVSQLRARQYQADVQALFRAHTLQDMARQVRALGSEESSCVPANLIPADCSKITPQMVTLTELDEQQLTDIAAAIPGGMANIQDIYPLAPLQEGVLFVHTMSEGQDPYVTSTTFEFDSRESLERFKWALNTLIARHDVLRTAILWRNRTTALQVVQREVALPVTELDLSKEADVWAAFSAHVAEQPLWIELENAPLLQLSVCKDAAQGKYYALLCEHHLISDHVSLEILVHELTVLLQGNEASLGEPVPYREFVGRTLARTAGLDTEAFFTKMLGDISEPTLPYGLTDVLNDGSGIETVHVTLDDVQAQRIRRLTRQYHSSPAALFHLVWAKVLGVCSGQSEVVFGTVLSGRMSDDGLSSQLMGMMINTLPLRVSLSEQDAMRLLAQINDDLRALMPYEQVSLAEAQRCSGVSGQLPLFSAMLNYRHSAVAESQLEQDAGFKVIASEERTNYPFNLSVDDFGDGFGFELQVDKRAPAARIAQYLQVTLTQVLDLLDSQSSTAVQSLCVLDEVERTQQLHNWNDTALDYPRELCIHELFEQQAAAAPEQVALCFGEQTLSYGELNRRANQLAHYLRAEHNIGPDSLVGLCVERSLEMVIGIWGILKAGGAYVPLDPELPPARLSYLVEDASAAVVLSTAVVAERVSLGEASVTRLDEFDFSAYPDTNIAVSDISLNAGNLAYTIYTSGSTGLPKGVLVEHQALHNRIDWMDNEYGCGPDDIILQKTPYSFDVSVWEFVWPMLKGAQLVIAKPGGHKEPEYLSELIVAAGITKLHFVPSMLGVMLEHGDLARCTSIDQVFCSGEALQISHVEQFRASLPSAQLHNLYGPTEAAIDVSYWDCSQPHGSSVPIGKPIQNIQLVILDESLNLLPQGACGELHIGGEGLARGYHNRPELTAERFIDNPFKEILPSSRLYKTGDLVRFRDDGCIEYMGRMDHQVKIRGLRIELGEIEYHIGEHYEVDSALVMALSDAQGNQRLVAYVKPLTEQSDQTLIESIVTELSQSLAQYMIPASFVLIDEWPQTPNGKIDRKALPAPDQADLSHDYVPPQSDTERTLAAIWADVLNLPVEQVSRDANFFALGGHSLLVMQLLSRVKQLGYQCQAQALFKAGSLSAMAAHLDAQPQVEFTFNVPPNRIPEKASTITPEMLPLIELAQDEIDAMLAKVPGGAANVQDMYPLAPLQEGVLFVHTLNQQHDPYVSTMAFELAGSAQLAQLIDELNFVIERHDVLRTAIFWRGRAQAVQVVLRDAQLPVSELPLKHAQIKAQFEDYVANAAHGFELESAPLIQLMVSPQDEQGKVYALLKFHHLITDHVSLEILLSELSAPNKAQLPAPLPYRDFIARSMAQSAELDTAAFFTKLLGDIDTPTLPFGLSQVTGDGSAVAEYSTELGMELSQQIRALARGLQCSPAALFHLAWAQVLSACTGRDEVVFGTVMSGRMNAMPGIERMMGMLINTLPLRVTLGQQSAEAALGEVNEALQALLPYEQVSLAEAQSHSGLSGNTPLFSAILNYRHTAHDASAEAGGESTARLLSTRERTNYPFDLSVNDLGEQAPFTLDFQIEQSVEASRIAALMDTALNALVAALTTNSSQPVATLAVLPAAEVALQNTWQSAQASYPRMSCIHELFESQAAATPENIAVQLNAQALSYGELNARANQLAQYLRETHQVGTGTLVGLCIGRSLELLVATLAILKAGGAYVPLDPAYPESRLAYMLEDTQLTVILTEQAQHEVLAFSSVAKVSVDIPDAPWSSLSDLDLPRAEGLTAQSIAYVIYTSGSTGTPKGVMTPHRAVNRLVYDPNFMTLNNQTVFLQSANIAFDAATLEIWGPLLNGGRCVLYPEAYLSLDGINKVLRTQGITAMWLTSGLFSEWSKRCGTLTGDALALQTVLAGGDVLNPHAVTAVQAALPEVTVVNGYGPTENTTFTACYPVPAGKDISAGVPIGRGIQGDELLILSPQGRLLPSGVAGELCVGGDGLALGYLNQSQLSNERFIANPYITQSGQATRLYRTGDLVRFGPDGLLEYIGRMDDQIKIRGFRVELGEIETALNADARVAQSLVTVDKARGLIVAYVEPQSGLSASELTTQLRASLAASLPPYMVPSAWQLIDVWPLTANGKIDRKALPEVELTGMTEQYVAPQTALEQQLVTVVASLLEVEPDTISMSANFFDLGGHSLLMMRLMSEIKAHWQIELSVAEVFECQYLSQVAELIHSEMALQSAFDDSDIDEDEEVLEI